MEFINFEKPVFFTIVIAVAIWDLVWKGLALWKAAKNNHLVWFVCIMIFNTVGILPIFYILLNKKNKKVE